MADRCRKNKEGHHFMHMLGTWEVCIFCGAKLDRTLEEPTS